MIVSDAKCACSSDGIATRPDAVRRIRSCDWEQLGASYGVYCNGQTRGLLTVQDKQCSWLGGALRDASAKVIKFVPQVCIENVQGKCAFKMCAQNVRSA